MLKIFIILLMAAGYSIINQLPVYAIHVNIPILLYHRIANEDNELCVSPERFEQQIQALSNAGYQTITLKQMKQLVLSGAADNLPNRPLLITFDDGYKDTYTTAYPILRKYGFTGVIFVVPDFFYLPGYITPSQVLEMHYFGMDIGSHTKSHAILTQQTKDDMVQQLTKSKQELETLLEQPVEFLAYPYGCYNQTVLREVEQVGYCAGFTVTPGINVSPFNNPYKLKRISIFRDTKNVLSEINYGYYE